MVSREVLDVLAQCDLASIAPGIKALGVRHLQDLDFVADCELIALGLTVIERRRLLFKVSKSLRQGREEFGRGGGRSEEMVLLFFKKQTSVTAPFFLYVFPLTRLPLLALPPLPEENAKTTKRIRFHFLFQKDPMTMMLRSLHL